MQSSSLCIFKTMSIPARHDPALRKLSAYPLIRSVGSASCRHHCVDVWPAVAVYSLILRTAYPKRLCVDTLRSRQPGCASRSRATFLQLATVTRVPMLVYTGVSKWSGLPTVLGLGLNARGIHRCMFPRYLMVQSSPRDGAIDDLVHGR